MKKLGIILFLSVLFFGCGKNIDYIIYEIDEENKTASIVGVDENYPSNIIIPSVIDGYTITLINDLAFEKSYHLESISIPSSVKVLGTSAFYGCMELNTVTLNEGLEEIQEGVFFSCVNLVNIIIPSTVSKIGAMVFMGCTKLESITLPINLEVLNNATFYGCSSLNSVTISESLRIIGFNAFKDCIALENISLPNVVFIATLAFEGCSSLNSVLLFNSLEGIGGFAFSKCISLETITIPISVTTIYTSAFKDCNNLSIYCLIDQQPDTWNIDWNIDSRPVYFGYQG